MFQRIIERVGDGAARRAKARTSVLAEQIRANVPSDIEVSALDEGVRLSGRGLRRRFALDPALRWLMAGLK